MPYNHKQIESKWQERWEGEQPWRAEDGSSKPKFYCLIEFPYPSGAGLHVGHPRSYSALDAVSRKKRMEGYNVLYPIGWDAFGLPTENYAIKTGRKPADITRENTDTFRRQLKALGLSFDWSREVDTTDPEYYKWTQWMFLEFFKAGLAYKAKTMINWCPKDKIGLANEEAAGGSCDRCGGPVEKREKEQWMIAITKYADRLLEDLNTVNYLPKIKKQQEDWIGKSEGAEVSFELTFTFKPDANANRGPNGEKAQISVFTTRPDTLFGASCLVLAPEHLWVTLATDDQHDVLENKDEVRAYLEQVKNKTDIDRTAEGKEKTGVELKGVKAINPANGEEIPMFVADYVLPQYGTGAIMAVPAHDERDWEFAKTYGLPIRPVVAKHSIDQDNPPRAGMPTVRRNMVFVIVRRQSDGAVLLLHWKSNQRPDGSYPFTFVVGGTEEGESLAASALRELQEETGLTDVRVVEELPLALHSEYFAAHKQENRYADARIVIAETSGDGTLAVPAEELAKHEPVWVVANEVSSTITTTDMLCAWDQFNHPAAMTDKGVATNSDFLNDLPTDEAKTKMIDWLEEKGVGQRKITYKLRDWVFSRQRYWGEPIPLIHCDEHGWVAVPDEQLPLKLPDVEKYEPTDTGESPLAQITDWVNTMCPTCGKPAKRETDTMPNWAGSSWYFLAYVMKNVANFNFPITNFAEALKYWMPVDFYNGGMEHTTLHLLYSRFWNKFLFDRGHVPTSEPYARRHSHGLILAEDGTKMSKSKGNVVNPDEIADQYGADALRTYIMFMGPFEEPVPWSTNGLVGTRRFLDNVLNYVDIWLRNYEADNHDPNVYDGIGDRHTAAIVHKTIKKVSEDIEAMKFNTAIAALMICLNSLREEKIGTGEWIRYANVSKPVLESFLKLLFPFAPHLSSELWEKLGNTSLLDHESWPQFDPALVIDTSVTISVQIAGKMRGSVSVAPDAAQADVESLARADQNVAKWLEGQTVKKVIYIPGRTINFVL